MYWQPRNVVMNAGWHRAQCARVSSSRSVYLLLCRCDRWDYIVCIYIYANYTGRMCSGSQPNSAVRSATTSRHIRLSMYCGTHTRARARCHGEQHRPKWARRMKAYAMPRGWERKRASANAAVADKQQFADGSMFEVALQALQTFSQNNNLSRRRNRAMTVHDAIKIIRPCIFPFISLFIDNQQCCLYFYNSILLLDPMLYNIL